MVQIPVGEKNFPLFLSRDLMIVLLQLAPLNFVTMHMLFLVIMVKLASYEMFGAQLIILLSGFCWPS